VSHTKSKYGANVKNYEQAIQQSDKEETSSELPQAEKYRGEGKEKAGSCKSLTQS
jgi:ribosomal protein S20